jgi:hypothetical protein
VEGEARVRMRGFVDEEEEEEVVVRVDARRGRRMVDDRVMAWVVFGRFFFREVWMRVGFAVRGCTDFEGVLVQVLGRLLKDSYQHIFQFTF